MWAEWYRGLAGARGPAAAPAATRRLALSRARARGGRPQRADAACPRGPRPARAGAPDLASVSDGRRAALARRLARAAGSERGATRGAACSVCSPGTERCPSSPGGGRESCASLPYRHPACGQSQRATVRSAVAGSLLSEIRAVNFRSARQVVLRPGRICAFIGEPGAGKSNMLLALRALLDSSFELSPWDVTSGERELSIEATLADGRLISLDDRTGAPPIVHFQPTFAEPTSCRPRSTPPLRRRSTT